MSDSGPETRVDVSVVPDVADVLVSPYSVVTEFCDGFWCCSDWEFVETQSFLSPKSVLTHGQLRKKRWLTSEGASAIWKTNDAAYTTA